MNKDYMLICNGWNPLNGIWEHGYLFFSTEKEMKEYIISQGEGIRIERMCKLNDIK